MIKRIKSLAAGLSISFFAATSLFAAECIAPAILVVAGTLLAELLLKLCTILVLMIHQFK